MNLFKLFGFAVSFAVFLFPDASVQAQTGPGQRWSLPCQDVTDNMGISIGDRGMQVFGRFRLDPSVDHLGLLSSSDLNPPGLIWGNSSGIQSFDHRSDSAEEAPIHAVICSRWSDATHTRRNVVLRKFRSNGAMPDWTYNFPSSISLFNRNPLHVLLSRSGQTIVAAAYDLTSNQTFLARFQPGSGTPVLTRTLSLGQLHHMTMSADGSTILAQSSSTATLLDASTGNTIAAFGQGNSPCKGSLSRDGSVLGWGEFGRYLAFQKNSSGSGYSLRFIRALAGSLTFCNQFAISEDGSRLAAGALYGDNHTASVECLDLTQSLLLGSAVVSMSHTLVGSGSYQNVPSDLAISQDGSVLAFGVWGDGISVPEINVYRPDQDAPVFSQFLGGSVMDLDLSADGKRLVVNDKGAHANQAFAGRKLRLFDLGDSDLTLRGAPRLGATIAFRHYGAPGSPASLLASPALAAYPQTFPGSLGTLFLQRSTLSFLPMGNMDASGVATLAVSIPNDTALLGTSLYYQGFTSSPRHLGNDWIKVTVLP